ENELVLIANDNVKSEKLKICGVEKDKGDIVARMPREKNRELGELLKSDKVLYAHGYSATELQDMLSKRQLPQFIDRKAFTAQLVRILDIAADGLKARGKNEEHFLDPLYERAELLTNPAKAMVEGLENGRPMREFIEKYAAI
ncbi:MAG: hypothetical protein II574_03160, partial [Ruminococcus sp.]|nr:hypothetical protein [Ruminococcus sp.]